MPTKLVNVDSIGQVELIKRRGLKSIRLRVDSRGLVKVSVPWLVPHKFAMDFVASKRDWIIVQQRAITPFAPYSGMVFGKTHTLYVTELSQAYRSRITANKLAVSVVGRLDPADVEQQDYISKAMIRALKVDAKQCLSSRVETIAARNGVKYNKVLIKQLTGRWGSCDTHGTIVLSLFLAQLPWELIDYVIAHELAHIEHLNHSSKFWAAVESMYPDYKLARKQMRAWQPRVYASEIPT